MTGIDPANRDMSIEWKDASGELLRRTLSAEYVAASVGSGYALTNHGAQGQSIRHVHADPAGVGRNAAYVQATRSVERVDLYTDLNSLGIVGSERIDVLRMAPTQRAQWAARQLVDRINDLGWQHGETAHDATNTPIPMLEPPRVAAVPLEKERPYWGWTTKELDTKAEQLRGFVARAGQLPELAREIATKQLEADRLVAASATYAERGREWDQAAAELEALRTHHRASASATVGSDVDAMAAASRARIGAGRFSAKKTQNRYDDVRMRLGVTYPTAGIPRDLTDARAGGAWAERAVAEVEAARWGDTAERCRERLSGQYQLDRDKVEASPEGATRTELWTSTVPAKLVADTRTAAGEINARRQDVDNRHRDADVEIKRLQAVVEQAPQRGATAANTLADVGREQTIRASQPAEVQQLERETAAALR